jgi:hypothetical protein
MKNSTLRQIRARSATTEALNLKADNSTTYTKTEVDNKIPNSSASSNKPWEAGHVYYNSSDCVGGTAGGTANY